MRKGLVVFVALVVLGALVIGVAAAAGAFRSEEGAVSPAAAQQASTAALAATGGGQVREVEHETDEGDAVAYGVTVVKPDGSAVEVLLDSNFQVTQIQNEAEDEAHEQGEEAGHEEGEEAGE